MSRFDAQDVLLVLGTVFLFTGVALWSVPAALIVVGVLFLAFVVLIERGKLSPKSQHKGTDGTART